MERLLKVAEVLMWILGAVLVISYLGSRAEGETERVQGIAQFHQQRLLTSAAEDSAQVASEPTPALNTGSSPRAAVAPGASVLAVLRIARVDLEVPVKYGTGEDVLRGGAGLVEGTAWPGSPGNIAIAAHRDTFFRPLENVVVGDVIEVEAAGHTRKYRIVSLSVVSPDDVAVLENTGVNQLTLVTCFPFHYFGSAPQRFIVRADQTTLI